MEHEVEHMAPAEQPRQPGLRGVYFVLSTPFQPDFSIDYTSIRRLVGAALQAGVNGITALGVAGEAQKLNEHEREELVAVVVDAVAGRCPVIVGASHDGTELAISAAQAAEGAGAEGLLVAPPTFLQPGPSLLQHFRRISDATRLPIVLQDYPLVNGVTMSPAAMAELARKASSVTTIKLEGVPTPARTGQTLRLLPDGVTVLGGLGAVHLLDELRHGASGTMTGFAYPEVLVSIWSRWSHGLWSSAAEVYYRHLPILLLEGQQGVGLAIRKEILKRRGWIDHAVIREPGSRLDAQTMADIDSTLESIDPAQVSDRV